MSDGEVHFQRAGAVVTIVFDRPEARNAMTWHMYEQLGEACARITADPTSWGLVISPQSDAVVYTSSMTGEYQNYVEPYPPTGQRIQISITGGAEEPRWSDDGERIYYRSGRRIMVVDVERAPTLSVGPPRVVFEGDFVNVGGRSYDVSPDETRFLVIDDPVVTTTTLQVVQGWTAEIERLISDSGGSGG